MQKRRNLGILKPGISRNSTFLSLPWNNRDNFSGCNPFPLPYLITYSEQWGDLSSPFPSNIPTIIIFCSARWSVSIACQMDIHYSIAVIAGWVPHRALIPHYSVPTKLSQTQALSHEKKCILFKSTPKFIIFDKFLKTTHVHDRLASISLADFPAWSLNCRSESCPASLSTWRF